MKEVTDILCSLQDFRVIPRSIGQFEPAIALEQSNDFLHATVLYRVEQFVNSSLQFWCGDHSDRTDIASTEASE